MFYICHKFQFFSHAEWAKGAIFKPTFPLSSEPTEPDELDEPLKTILFDVPETDIGKLLAALAPCAVSECPVCKTTSETEVPAVWAVWLSRLQKDPSMSSRRALDCAQSLGLRTFLGRIYYTQVIISNARARPCRGTAKTTAFEDPYATLKLTAEHMAALYRGHWSLSRFWDSIRYPPEVDTSDEASHETECVSAWQEMWYEGIQGNGESPYQWNPIDALLRLSEADPAMESDNESHPVSRCGCLFREHARLIRQRLLTTLADHFVRPCTHEHSAQPVPQVTVMQVPAGCSPPLSVHDEETSLPRCSISPANDTPRARSEDDSVPEGVPKNVQRKREKQSRRTSKRQENTDKTTAILLRAWELQHGVGSSRSASSPSGTVTTPPPLAEDELEDIPVLPMPSEPSAMERASRAHHSPSSQMDTTHKSPGITRSQEDATVAHQPRTMVPTLPNRPESPDYWGESDGGLQWQDLDVP